MGTRCGDLDPAIPFFLSKEEGISIEEVDKILNKQSGLKGLCGSNDLRDIALKCEKGDSLSRRALDIYVRRIKKYIGSYIAVIGPVDAIVFTAGVGENSAIVREMVCAKLDHLGIEIDKSLNEQKGKSARMVQTVNSKVKILVVPTNEELEMARLSEEI
jgi:acetate kinase